MKFRHEDIAGVSATFLPFKLVWATLGRNSWFIFNQSMDFGSIGTPTINRGEV
jgi:hypothetical protein